LNKKADYSLMALKHPGFLVPLYKLHGFELSGYLVNAVQVAWA